MPETKLSGFKELMRAKAEREAKPIKINNESTSMNLVESTIETQMNSTLADWVESDDKENMDSTINKNLESTVFRHMDSAGESTKHTNNELVDSETPPIPDSGVHQKKVVGSRKIDRHNKNKTRIQPRIDKRILRRIKAYCAQTGMELGEYIERLALHHLELVESTKEKNQTPQIDKMITYRSSSLIINLYESLTKNRWTWRDDKEASRYSTNDVDSIEIAMIRTLIRAKEKIGSFKYFVPEIEKELAMNFNPDIKTLMLASAKEALNMKRMGFEVDA